MVDEDFVEWTPERILGFEGRAPAVLSDVEVLRGWAVRLERLLQLESGPNELWRFCVGPCRMADSALMRFGVRYGSVVAELRQAVSICNLRCADIAISRDKSTCAALDDAVQFLLRRLRTALEILSGSTESTVTTEDRGERAARIEGTSGGRPNETAEIARYAIERKSENGGITWKEIAASWRRDFPDHPKSRDLTGPKVRKAVCRYRRGTSGAG
jgi:hypothetical protein